jgi:ketopantoate reductase
MRILVVGAAAIGGYFGGRLIEAGRDARAPPSARLGRPNRRARRQAFCQL